MTRLLRRIAAFALIAGTALGGALPAIGSPPGGAAAAERSTLARAGVDDFVFASFTADYSLGRDDGGRSTLRTVEHLVAEFPEFDQNRGIIRDIPREYNGFDTRLDISAVTDEHGEPREFTTERNGEYLSVVIAVPEGSFVHGEQHYVIEYTQRDVTRAFDDTGADEFYWDVNGTAWRQPFGRVSATLTLGPGLADALTGGAACYRGAYGSTERCEIDVDGDRVTAEAAGLSAYENVTIAVGFEPGTFAAAQKPFFERFLLLVYGGIAVFAAGIATAAVTLVRNRAGARTGRAIIAQYDPPEGVSVALAAELLRSRRGMTATLLDLAVRRRIRLLHDEPTGQYGAQLLEPTGLSPDESRAVTRVFGASGPGATYWFDRRSTRLGDAAAALRLDAWNEASRRGLMRKTGGRTMLAVPLCFVIGLALPVLHSIIIGNTVLMTILLAVGINALVWFTVGVLALLRKSRAVTPLGAPIREHLLGLREYIRLAEADRIRMLQSPDGAEAGADRIVQVYERLLPYAVLFGLEREWQGELEPYYREAPPDWVSGSSGASSFSGGLSLSALGSAVSSSPTTRVSSSSGSGSGSSFSSSGGSSGGGSSGGGGGGGGGGGI